MGQPYGLDERISFPCGSEGCPAQLTITFRRVASDGEMRCGWCQAATVLQPKIAADMREAVRLADLGVITEHEAVERIVASMPKPN